MTKHLSQFGSLTDRTQASGKSGDNLLAPQLVRHAWLDENIPVLLLDWRKNDGNWEGYVLGIGPHGPALAWISSKRLQPTHGPPTQSEEAVDIALRA